MTELFRSQCIRGIWCIGLGCIKVSGSLLIKNVVTGPGNIYLQLRNAGN